MSKGFLKGKSQFYNNIFSSFFVVCKFKAHKRCAVKAQSNCKWTTLAAIGREILEDEDGVSNHDGLLEIYP